MSVSETYIALTNGFLHPSSLAPITIFEHDDHLYCIDTRRLTIAKELQRREKFDVLRNFPVQYVDKGNLNFAGQYDNLADERLPAFKKKGIDGSTIKLYSASGYMCCYSGTSGKFRDDLEEHIARDHMKMDLLEFKNINVSQCKQCNKKCRIIVKKSSNKGTYRFTQNCPCRTSESKELRKMEIPWTDVSLCELCDVFRQLTGRSFSIDSSLNRAVPSIDQSELLSMPTVRFTKQAHKIKEVENSYFTKAICGVLVRYLSVILLFLLIIIFIQYQSTNGICS